MSDCYHSVSPSERIELMSMDLMFAAKQMKITNEDSQDEKTKRKMTLKVFKF